MKIVQNYCTQSRAFTSNRKIVPKGIMIHSVGTPQPNAEVFQRIWNKKEAQAITHAVLGADGIVIQCLPWNARAWHARFDANNTHISVEMTEPNTIKYISGSNWVELKDGVNTRNHVMETYKTSVKLFAHLCKLYKFNPLQKGVIISHAEGYKMGIASNHGDPEHVWRKFGLTMDQFRQDIAKEMNLEQKTEVEKPKTEISETEKVKEIQRKLTELGYAPKGGIDGLYGPGTKAAVKEFQRDAGLVQDGLAGPLTQAKMNEILNSKKADKERVKDIQSKLISLGYSLIGGADGSYGPSTTTAVRSFQKDNGLSVDGIAGPITMKKLDELVNKTKEEKIFLRVVVGTYGNRNNAVALQESLKKVGISAFLVAFKDEQGNTLLRVVAGTYTERANAENRMEELRKKGYSPFLAAYKESEL